MNAMTMLFGGPLGQAIGWALLHLLWQGVLVAAILAATLALLRRQSANARYLASCGALVVIIGLGVVTAYRAYDPLREVEPASSMSATAAPIAIADVSADVIAASSPDRLASIATFVNSHLPQIVLVWLLGVTLLSTRLIVGWIGAHRLASRRAHPAEPQWERALKRIAEALQLRRTVRLLESAAVEVPTVIGWIRPVVLLPVASLAGLSTEQIEMILAHELAHIRRHDFIVNLLQSTVETLLFYHPAVWWISRRIRVEREHCCDDVAVSVFGDPIRYARALTRFEELRLDSAQTVLAVNGGSLLGRIRRLVAGSGESANWSSRWTAGAALLTVVAALLFTPALPLFAKHEEQAAPPPPHTTVEVTPQPEKKAECDNRADDEADVDVDISDDNMDEITPPPPRAMAPRIRIRPVIATTPRPAPLVMPNVRAIVAPALAYAAPIAAGAMSMFVEPDEPQSATVENGKLSVDELIELRTAGVTPKYIEDMRAIGLGDMSMRRLAEMKMQGVTPEYVRDLRAAGIDVKSSRTVIELKVMGVSSKYIQDMAAAGYKNLSAHELVELRSQGVSPKYIQDMAGAGYKSLTPRDLVELRAQGVSPEFVKALADAGYTNLSARDLVRLAASGVNAEFIRDLAKYRTK